MARSGAFALLVRLVPGAAEQPDALAKRRLLTGLTVLVIAVMLQSVPTAMRNQAVAPTVYRAVWGLVEMLTLAGALSMTYDWNQRRRATTLATLLSTVAVAIAGSGLFVFSWRMLTRAYPFLHPTDGPARTIGFHLAMSLVIGMLHTGVWALAFVYPYVTEDALRRALEADKLRLEAEQLKVAAELARLRSQLEPHFLLNTLNAIAGFVTEQPKEARRLIACLGDLLRDSLEDGDELQPLEAEIAWLQRYAEILESRHAGTLTFRWEIEPATKRTLVPRLLLQPLVENAVKHGALRRRGGGGLVVVRTSVIEQAGEKHIVCVVEDNGPGMPATQIRQGAFGLHSVRRRLEIRFPKAVLKLESSADGMRSIVDLPVPAALPAEKASAEPARALGELT